MRLVTDAPVAMGNLIDWLWASMANDLWLWATTGGSGLVWPVICGSGLVWARVANDLCLKRWNRSVAQINWLRFAVWQVQRSCVSVFVLQTWIRKNG
jgi:hypothetical protein